MSRSLVLALLLAAPMSAVGTAARAARFRRSGRAAGPGGGEHQHDLDRPRPVRACRPGSEEDPFYDFFRRFGPPQPREYESRSLGSGFIISADGYILTNAHVVEAADEITVRLTDKREFKAKVIGSDRRTDVALLKIEATGLPGVDLRRPQQAAGRRMGGGDRLAVRLREHGDRRHRQRQGPLAAAGELRSRSSRPTWRSTRATPAGRCST